jgi:hypothetical protein
MGCLEFLAPWLTNVGNTCYLNSTLQILKNIPGWGAYVPPPPPKADKKKQKAKKKAG